jgi:hypothetical protein
MDPMKISLINTENERSPVLVYVLLLLSIAIFCVYALLIHSNAINLPLNDDYYDVLFFYESYLNASSASEKIASVTAQHLDHLNVFSRLVYIVFGAVYGEMDFHILTILANLCFPGIALLYFISIKRRIEAPMVCYAIVAFAMFQLCFYRLSVWSMASMSHGYAWLFIFATIVLLFSKHKYAFALAVLMALLSPFTLAPGILVLGLGFLALLVRKFELDETVEVWRIILWLVWSLCVAVLFLSLYDLHFDRAAASPIEHVLKKPVARIEYLFAYIGSAFYFGRNEAAILAGVTISSLYLVLVYLRSWRTTPELFCFLTLLMMTAPMLAFTKGIAGVSPIFTVPPRYAFISMNMALCIALSFAALEGFRTRVRTEFLLLPVIAFCIGSYTYNLPLLKDLTKFRIDGYCKWQQHGDHRELTQWPWLFKTNELATILQQSIDSGYFHPPTRLCDN